jgi:hypothetical protein
MTRITLAPNASGTGTLTLAAPNTNTDYVVTLPDATSTLVSTTATQTLTNKTIGSTQITGFEGMVATFAMNTPPAGWIKADGAAISRSTYAALFTAIGTTFGVGDGSTTFNVPDLRGEFIRGWDDSRGIDSGRAFGSAQTDQFQGHGHTLTGRQHAAGTGTANEFADTGAAESYSNTTSVQDPVARSNGTPRTGNETRPRSIALLACIKY